MNRTNSMIIKGVAALVAIYVLWIGFKWTVMREYVPPDKALLVMNKFGDPLPPTWWSSHTGRTITKACRKKCSARGDISSTPSNITRNWSISCTFPPAIRIVGNGRPPGN
jgi:hypothetical protein